MYTRGGKNDPNKVRDQRRRIRSHERRARAGPVIDTPIGHFRSPEVVADPMIDTPIGRFRSPEVVADPMIDTPLGRFRSPEVVADPSALSDPSIVAGPIERKINFDDEEDMINDRLMDAAKKSREADELGDILMSTERFHSMNIPKDIARRIAGMSIGSSDMRTSRIISGMIPEQRAGRRLMSGNNNMGGVSSNTRPLTGAGGGIPNTYNDHLAPESQISQSAHDREEYKGVDPRGWSASDLRDIERLRMDEHKDDAQRVYDMVNEVEVLSGGNNDSLMDANDLVDDHESKHDENDDSRGHATSGFDRGRMAHAVQEIDLENMDASLNQFFDNFLDEYDLSDDTSSIGRRFGEAIPSVRGMGGDVMSGADSIMSTISGLTSLSDQDGSWFSPDKELEKNVDMNERMSGANKIPMNKDTRDNFGKFNSMNAGNKLLMSQGASLGTIAEMRSKSIEYQQPNRKVKGNSVNLLRLGRQTQHRIDNEFEV